MRAADGGLAAIAATFQAGVGTGPGGEGLDDGAAAGGVAAEMARHRRLLVAKAAAAWPVEVPPMIYSVSGGLLVAGQGLAGAEHMGPRTGYLWDVTNVTVDGLAGGTPQQQQGSVTSPGSHVTVAQIGAANLIPGDYVFNWSVDLDGTPAAIDANNFQVLFSGGAVLATSENNGAVGHYAQPSFDITVPAGSAALVVRTAAAGTAGAIYSASFSLTPNFPADTVVLYKRFGNAPGARRHTFTAPGSTPGPDWQPGRGGLMLRDGDRLQLAGTGLAAAQVVLNVDAVQIEQAWIGDYFL